MTLDEFLNRQKVETLQRFEIFWTNNYRCSTSKSGLLVNLRRAMLDPKRLTDRFQNLSVAERRLLEIVLLSTNDSSSVSNSSIKNKEQAGFNSQIDELLRSLADKGFIYVRPGPEYNNDISIGASINLEMTEALKKMFRSDVRHPDQLLSLESFVHSLTSPKIAQQLQAIGQSRVSQGQTQSAFELLREKDSIDQRIKSVKSEELQVWVDKATHSYGGMIPIRDILESDPRLDKETLADWKKQLEALFLGTIGMLSLEHLGINVRDEYLIIFSEVVIAILSEHTAVPAPGEYKAQSSGNNVILDFIHIIHRIQREDLGLTKDGSLRKYGRDETLSSLFLADNADPEDDVEYLEQMIRIGLELELFRCLPDRTLTPTLKIIEWTKQSLEIKTQDILNPIVFNSKLDNINPHGRSLYQHIGKWCSELKQGQWYPCHVAANLALIRYLLNLIRGDAGFSNVIFNALHSSPVSLEHLANEFLELTCSVPHRYGLFDIAYIDGKAELIRNTAVSARFFSYDWLLPIVQKQHLIVNPDFELVLFPQETDPNVHCIIHQMAVLNKTDQVCHYKIKESSVRTAAALGMSSEEMVGILEENCRGSLPQNIVYSIQSWAKGVYNVSIESVHIFELDSPELLQHVRHLPEIKPLLLRELSPTVLALKGPIEERAAIRALVKLGIYLRRSS